MKIHQHFLSKPMIPGAWRIDETYVKGTWVYHYRAVDSEGNAIDFY